MQNVSKRHTRKKVRKTSILKKTRLTRAQRGGGPNVGSKRGRVDSEVSHAAYTAKANAAREERLENFRKQRELAFKRIKDSKQITIAGVTYKQRTTGELRKMRKTLEKASVPVFPLTPAFQSSVKQAKPMNISSLYPNIMRRYNSLRSRQLVMIFAHANLLGDIDHPRLPFSFNLQEKTDLIFIPEGGVLTSLTEQNQKHILINRESFSEMLILNDHASEMRGRDNPDKTTNPSTRTYPFLTSCSRAKKPDNELELELPNFFFTMQDSGPFKTNLGVYLLNSSTQFVNNPPNINMLIGPNDEVGPGLGTDWYLSEIIDRIKLKYSEPIILIASCSGPDKSLKLKELANIVDIDKRKQYLFDTTEYVSKAQTLINTANVSYADPGITTFTPNELIAAANAANMAGTKPQYNISTIIPKDFGSKTPVTVMHQDFLANYFLSLGMNFDATNDEYKDLVDTGNDDIALKAKMLMNLCINDELAKRVRIINQTPYGRDELQLLSDLCGGEPMCSEANLKELIPWLLRE